jgi:hypothetical protein
MWIGHMLRVWTPLVIGGPTKMHSHQDKARVARLAYPT